MYTSCKKLVGVYKTCRCISEIYTPTSFIYTYKFFTRSLQPFNMQMYRTIISTLITCNQFITMVQVGYITRLGLCSIYTASGPSALGV